MLTVHYQKQGMKSLAFWSEHADFESARKMADTFADDQFKRFRVPLGVIVTDDTDPRHPIDRTRLYHTFREL